MFRQFQSPQMPGLATTVFNGSRVEGNGRTLSCGLQINPTLPPLLQTGLQLKVGRCHRCSEIAAYAAENLCTIAEIIFARTVVKV